MSPKDNREAVYSKGSPNIGQKSWRREEVFSGTLPLIMANEIKWNIDLPQRAVEALLEGDRNKAIEHVQREQSLSREDARELVASFILSQPSMMANMRMVESRAGTHWGLLRWFILLQAIAVAIGYFLFFRDQW
ncbi:MAG TPA: hypothetical protein PKD12_19585 [Nitrospira sp.]|nr:hypothetical protein [Nitrospira sp.]